MLLLLLLLIAMLVTASERPDLFPFIDPRVVRGHIHVSIVISCAWALLLLAALRARRSQPGAAWLAHLPIQLFSIDNAFNAYMLGIFTNPFGVLSLAGGLPVALLAYGAKRTWLGAMTFGVLLAAATLGSQLGVIPYAPLMLASPVSEGHLSPAWVLGFGGLVVVGCGVLMFVSHRIVAEIRAREVALRAKHAQLFSLNEDLVQARSDLELSRNALERRVELRTRELRESNVRLRDEIERRSELSDELEALRLLMEDAVEGIAWLDADGRIQAVNGAYAEMHGSTAEHMLGTHWSDWTHSEDCERVGRSVARINGQLRQELDFRGVRVDGSEFFAAVVMVADSRSRRGHHFRFVRDVTRNRELSLQLTHASKMEAVGRLAGGVAHDFNNLLTTIVVATEELAGSPAFGKGSHEVEELLFWIRGSAERGVCLTRQLLDFSRPQSEDRELLDVNASLRGVVAILGPALGERIKIRADFAKESLPAFVSEGRLQASLMGLAFNGRDAMPDGGELRFSTGLDRIDRPEQCFAGSPMTPGRYVRIEVRDQGVGIPEAMLGTVFEPFFTTKAPGEGTGLGLPNLYSFVSEMGGGVRVESSVGEGTRVCILLPLAAHDEAVQLPEPPERPESASATILVAEDEEIVRQVLLRMLRATGYHVIGCRDGEEALREYSAHASSVDLVLLDVRMPIRGGVDVLRGLREAGSQVPVILMSGNLSRAEVASLGEREFLGNFSVLNKPFGRPDLTKAIEEAMNCG